MTCYRRLSFQILLLIMLFVGCDKGEKLYTSQEIVTILKEGDPKAGFRIADHLKYDELISKEEVPSDGLFRFHYLKARELGFIGLEYKTYWQAKKAAKLIKGVHKYNWAFDEVTNEPVLEKYLEKYLGTKRP